MEERDDELRDFFAGQALPAAIARAKAGGMRDSELTELFGKGTTGIRREEIAAALAYRYADAMLAHKNKGR